MGKRLGNRTDLDASILLEMVMVQEQVLEGNGALLPWFLETATEHIGPVRIQGDFAASVQASTLMVEAERVTDGA